MIIAISYAEMLRYVGGVPIIDHAIEPDENMKFPRATFSETVDYIIKLIDDAKMIYTGNKMKQKMDV